jgi:ABC-type glycerol-3-phosphate transport system permease component
MRIYKTRTKIFLKLAVLQLAVLGMLAIVVPPTLTMAASSTANQSDISSGGLPQVNAGTDNIKNVLRIVFGIIGSFALLNITISGLKYITAAGNSQQISEAKNGIVYSLIGLMIAIAAEAIVAFVVHRTT